jgi:1-acyl-sn-glycerol-3-phosphate acyltransferase
VAWSLTNIAYRLKVIGRENLPLEGPFVIACNHITYVDGLVISSSCPRPARFVMYYKYFDMPFVSRLFKDSKVIPIAGAHEAPEVLDAAFNKIAAELEDGEVVGIFPEGALTDDGKIHPFRPGIEKIIRRTPVPVVPACMNGLWGSYFSKKYRGKEHKPFRRKWSRISIEFGKPMPAAEVTADKLFEVINKMKMDEEWSVSR